jgi:polyhydroxyalkanoate synthesis regulator phasin
MTDNQIEESSATHEPHRERATGSVRRWLGGGALALALSALLLGGTALAQGSTSNASGLQQSFMERLAQKLGLSNEELESTIDEAGNEVIDEAVTNGDLTEEQGDALRQQLETQPGFPSFGRRHGDGPGVGCGVDLETVATTLGMTTDELRAELDAGTALTDIISAHGSTVEAVVDALVAERQAELEAAVADGRLTQAQADEILADLPARLTDMIESDMLGPWHHRVPGDDSDGSDDNTDATETSAGIL